MIILLPGKACNDKVKMSHVQANFNWLINVRFKFTADGPASHFLGHFVSRFLRFTGRCADWLWEFCGWPMGDSDKKIER